MVMYIKDNGFKDKNKDKVLCFFVMEINIKVYGNKINNLVKEFIFEMEKFIVKDNGVMDNL